MIEAATDAEGFLVNLQDWNEGVAESLAAAERIRLEEAHWQVIHTLRRFYSRTDVAPAMRAFVKLVGEELGPEKGRSIYLMQLFGESPAKMAAKLSGLPRPTNCL